MNINEVLWHTQYFSLFHLVRKRINQKAFRRLSRRHRAAHVRSTDSPNLIHTRVVLCQQFNIDIRFRSLTVYNFMSTSKKYICTYIIGHYNPSVRIIVLVSHTTYVVCVNFIHEWRDLQPITLRNTIFHMIFVSHHTSS